jgi:hypothetical protein
VTFCPSYDARIWAVAGAVFGNWAAPGVCTVCACKQRHAATIEMHNPNLQDVMKAIPAAHPVAYVRTIQIWLDAEVDCRGFTAGIERL